MSALLTSKSPSLLPWFTTYTSNKTRRHRLALPPSFTIGQWSACISVLVYPNGRNTMASPPSIRLNSLMTGTQSPLLSMTSPSLVPGIATCTSHTPSPTYRKSSPPPSAGVLRRTRERARKNLSSRPHPPPHVCRLGFGPHYLMMDHSTASSLLPPCNLYLHWPFQRPHRLHLHQAHYCRISRLRPMHLRHH